MCRYYVSDHQLDAATSSRSADDRCPPICPVGGYGRWMCPAEIYGVFMFSLTHGGGPEADHCKQIAGRPHRQQATASRHETSLLLSYLAEGCGSSGLGARER